MNPSERIVHDLWTSCVGRRLRDQQQSYCRYKLRPARMHERQNLLFDLSKRTAKIACFRPSRPPLARATESNRLPRVTSDQSKSRRVRRRLRSRQRSRRSSHRCSFPGRHRQSPAPPPSQAPLHPGASKVLADVGRGTTFQVSVYHYSDEMRRPVSRGTR